MGQGISLPDSPFGRKGSTNFTVNYNTKRRSNNSLHHLINPFIYEIQILRTFTNEIPIKHIINFFHIRFNSHISSFCLFFWNMDRISWAIRMLSWMSFWGLKALLRGEIFLRRTTLSQLVDSFDINLYKTWHKLIGL